MIATGLQGNKRWSSRAGARSARTETQILDDIRAQHPACLHRVDGEAFTEGFGHYRAADDGTSFENQYLFAFFRQICRGDQSIVARSYESDVEQAAAYFFFLSTARCSWALFIFERPLMPRRFAWR